MKRACRSEVRLAHRIPEVALFVAASLVAPATEAAPGPQPPLAQALCPAFQQGAPDLLQELALPGPRPDYLALRVLQSDAEGRITAATLAELGTRCGHASNAAACEDALAHANPLGASPSLSLSPYFLVVQRGNEQRTIATAPQLAALLGPIDTLHEAALVATLRGHTVRCGVTRGELRDGHWLLGVRSGTGCGEDVLGRVLRIDRNATLTVQSTTVLQVGGPCGG